MQNLSNLTTEHIKEPSKGTWLTKDRKWAFIFWLVMSFGSTLAASTSGISNLEELPWIIFGTIFIMLITSMLIFNRTKSITDDRFLNSEGIEIKTNQLPGPLLGIIITGTIAFLIMRSWLYFDIFNLHNFGFFIWFSIFSLYFIIKNCPITILLNKNFIKVEPVEGHRKCNYQRTTHYNKNQFNSDRNNIVTNPAYSSLGCNIYNNKRY